MSLVSAQIESSKHAHANALVDIQKLRGKIAGSVLTPDDTDFPLATMAWSLGIRHSPLLCVLPESAKDVATTVSFARDHGLPVAVQSTGHGATVPCVDGILINTSRMQDVEIDPSARTARVEAGVKWASVIPLAQEHGLAPLSGSSSDVGVIGYTLGGGSGWLARKYGFAADRMIAADLVTADGVILHVSATEHADLFWALHGGSGNFGIVTALEFELVPVETLFGGSVFYPLTDAVTVMTAFASWVETLPEEVTASISIMRFPPMPDLPPMLRGQQVIILKACAVGDLDAGADLIAPMRSLSTPVLDTFGVMPYSAIDTISNDPVDPMPAISSTLLIEALTPEAITRLLDVVGPDRDVPVLMVDIRHVAGAGRDASTGCANRHEAPFVAYAIGIAVDQAGRDNVQAAFTRIQASLAQVASDRVFLNFLGDGDSGPERTRAAYSEDDYARLARIKSVYDPENRFRFNLNIRPARG